MYKIDRMFIAPVSHQCHMIWLYFCGPFTLKGKQEKYNEKSYSVDGETWSFKSSL